MSSAGVGTGARICSVAALASQESPETDVVAASISRARASRRSLMQELDALLDERDDDLPPEEEHDEDCDCGFCGPCGAWAFARGEHPAQRARVERARAT